MANRVLVAEWWRCGDEVCDCVQPQIVERSVAPFGQSGWSPPVTVEQGPFHSGPDHEDWVEMEEWLRQACERRGIEFPA